jgi:membrane-bound lytic murein transglycosylase B
MHPEFFMRRKFRHPLYTGTRKLENNTDDHPCWMETAVAQWLRYCATNQKVAGSISDGVMEFFIDINPSDRTMAMGSTQPLTEISTGSIS